MPLLTHGANGKHTKLAVLQQQLLIQRLHDMLEYQSHFLQALQGRVHSIEQQMHFEQQARLHTVLFDQTLTGAAAGEAENGRSEGRLGPNERRRG